MGILTVLPCTASDFGGGEYCVCVYKALLMHVLHHSCDELESLLVVEIVSAHIYTTHANFFDQYLACLSLLLLTADTIFFPFSRAPVPCHVSAELCEAHPGPAQAVHRQVSGYKQPHFLSTKLRKFIYLFLGFVVYACDSAGANCDVNLLGVIERAVLFSPI
jgi:hypothetical protein